MSTRHANTKDIPTHMDNIRQGDIKNFTIAAGAMSTPKLTKLMIAVAFTSLVEASILIGSKYAEHGRRSTIFERDVVDAYKRITRRRILK